ncbi:hypothetical protein CSC94_15905 [Zhengella mangrovi]|uniref:APC family permease n=1 Tax=Zhengella mangrovi TaxID=1982044 RepID=A0A2G1QKQ5_9HYPH|nr:hypothetical protein [Zhengella mangrovi]PHP66082.1 hypothetical protein CSC94_15905 [Zhengella mangrovi]
MTVDLAIIAALVLAALVLFRPSVTNNSFWRATVTPLASIIGSGFLILGPVLDHGYGDLAPAVMAGLCAVAWMFGGAIRYNIAALHDGTDDTPLASRIETTASWTLALAYFISVAYYLNLFGAFAARIVSADDPVLARSITSIVMGIVLVIGWTRGFKALERLEELSVSTKLAIIAGLLAGLAVFFVGKVSDNGLVINPVRSTGWEGITLAFGLIVTVQGFETSRYLRQLYDAETRIRSMRLAQIIASVIYVVYIVLMAYVFPVSDVPVSETGVIDMTSRISVILPVMLIVAALSAQFSAAIADTGGSGGLVHELTNGRVRQHLTYAALAATGLSLTWIFNIFSIISYASRGFALYYGLQAMLAGIRALSRRAAWPRIAFYFTLAVLGLAMTILGRPVE